MFPRVGDVFEAWREITDMIAYERPFTPGRHASIKSFRNKTLFLYLGQGTLPQNHVICLLETGQLFYTYAGMLGTDSVKTLTSTKNPL